jgi:DNA N-6-adenine-methyltransferase (Dam).
MIFENEFYPTPKGLVEKMLENVEIGGYILEPSAGSGNIADVIREKFELQYPKGSYRKAEPLIDCIEIDDNLASILKGKGYHVVHDDFLTFNSLKRYSTIIMNPPFSNGEQHLLKALAMQENGGEIVCLLNAQTLKNPYKKSQQALLNTLESKTTYSVEYIEQAFSNSEHKTNVEVALLKISIPTKPKASFFKSSLEKARQVKEESHPDLYQLAENDLVGQSVKQFELEAEMGINLIQEYKAMAPYLLKDFEKEGLDRPILELKVLNGEFQSVDVSENEFLMRLRYKYWSRLFANRKFTDQYTSSMIRELYTRLDDLANFDFSYYNIKSLQLDMTKSLMENMEETILKVFEELSMEYSYTSYSKNIHYYSGWKTNKSWFVNQKVIIPFNGFDQWGEAKLDIYKIVERFNDYEKSLNYLNGNKPVPLNLKEVLNEAIEKGQIKDIKFNHFTVSFFKKGTAWITFNDLDLLKRLNLFAGQRKAWLPPTYGTKAYSEMSEEEQAVVNEFEGEASYNELIQEPGKWLLNQNFEPVAQLEAPKEVVESLEAETISEIQQNEIDEALVQEFAKEWGLDFDLLLHSVRSYHLGHTIPYIEDLIKSVDAKKATHQAVNRIHHNMDLLKSLPQWMAEIKKLTY